MRSAVSGQGAGAVVRNSVPVAAPICYSSMPQMAPITSMVPVGPTASMSPPAYGPSTSSGSLAHY